MPSSHSVSPVKPPVKRSVSSPQAPSAHSPSSRNSPTPAAHQPPPHKSPALKSHRPHVVGTHRVHGRTQSHKNLNKLQRLALAHNLAADGVTAPSPNTPRHQRKKSAPGSPSTSPRTTQNHVRWNQSTISLTGSSNSANVRKNLSTPALGQSGLGILVKKGNTVNEAGKKNEKQDSKKSVGFELAASDDEDEWEDHSSVSASSTRRNSIASGKMNGQNSLTLPVSAGKSPLVHESHTIDVHESNNRLQDEQSQNEQPNHKDAAQTASDQARASDQHLIASRILNQPHSSKVPPAVTSISATATPLPSQNLRRGPTSITNMTSSLNPARHSPTPSAPSSTIPGQQTATSSSIEGGVSRFLIGHGGPRIEPRSDSDPSAPSSFLPHYHPRTPPSPESSALKRARSPKRPTNGPIEPHSRIQQKLWLQRTATMSNSPPEPFIPGIPNSALDSHYLAGVQNRGRAGGYGLDARRFMMGGVGPTGVLTAEAEAKRSKKVYEKFSTEYTVVHRFKHPVADSLIRLRKLPGTPEDSKTKRDQVNGHKPTRPQSQGKTAAPPPKESGVGSQFLSKAQPSKSSQVKFQGKEGGADAGKPEKTHSAISVFGLPFRRSLQNGNAPEPVKDTSVQEPNSEEPYEINDDELLLRRMWESREVAVAGD